MTILVTGGMGFIGSNFIRRWLAMNDEPVVNYDYLTYAGNPQTLADLNKHKNYEFIHGDIASPIGIKVELQLNKPRIVFNFAAESHVDNSITDSSPFARTNVLGTLNLLEQIRLVLPETLLIHVSTDEVFGELELNDPPFNEKTPYAPRSPYAASKAASDHFVRAYAATHGLRTIITNCSNNYGPYQHPEKFIPTVIRKMLAGEKIPVYGTGMNIRDWLHVEDHCDALIQIAERGRVGESYCIGGGTQKTNIEIATAVIGAIGGSFEQIEFVEDRKGHDFRYDIDSEKLYLDVGWQARTPFSYGLRKTVDWYMNNMEWVNSCLKHSESFSRAASLLDSTLQLSQLRSKSCLSMTNP
jgi:dTDP-glucose 4,6-dehydratase